jgi:N-terminal region of glycosyl transferase group 7/N-terminal domain of galactosyltransferase
MADPKFVFIIPYRDREIQKNNFIDKMKELLIDIDPSDYNFFFIHQCDSRIFNRGALKNIGFIMLKNAYPYTYKNITLCFNDVDTIPSCKGLITDYCTIEGVIKHFYGYQFTLGGIVSINAHDFEKINGFPNYWAWGFEDNMLYNRAISAGIYVDRSVFYKIDDLRITQINNSPIRVVSKVEFSKYYHKDNEGITDISNLHYNIVDMIVDVTMFTTKYLPNPDSNMEYDTRSTQPPFSIPRRGAMGLTIISPPQIRQNNEFISNGSVKTQNAFLM